MDKNRLLEVWNLPPETPIILTAHTVELWGQTQSFSLSAEYAGIIADGVLRFRDCRELRTLLYTHMQHPDRPAFPPAEMVALKLGRSQHRSPAHLLTEYFGLSLVYGECHLIIGEMAHPLT